MRFLVVFCAPGYEQGSSIIGVVSEFIHGCGFEVGVVAAQLVVRIDLVQRVLVPEKLILRETQIVSLRVELISLLGRKILAPAPRMVPVVPLQRILYLFVNHEAIGVGIAMVDVLLEIAALIAWLELSNLEIGLSHLLFLLGNVEPGIHSRL